VLDVNAGRVAEDDVPRKVIWRSSTPPPGSGRAIKPDIS